MNLEMELDMSKDGLGFEVSTKLQNYTGFSPLQLLIVVAIMVFWPKTPIGYFQSAKPKL
jgi:hypothetical protein